MALLTITHIEELNNYLKIFGQFLTQRPQVTIIQNHIDSILLNGGIAIPMISDIYVGMMCLAKRQNIFCRATVSAINGKSSSVQIEFIDYGNKADVNVNELRVITASNVLGSIAPQSFSFILSGVVFNWKPEFLEEIVDELLMQTIEIRKEMEFQKYIFARIIWRHGDYTEYLVKRGIGYAIPIEKIGHTFGEVISAEPVNEMKYFNEPSSTPVISPVSGITIRGQSPTFLSPRPPPPRYAPLEFRNFLNQPYPPMTGPPNSDSVYASFKHSSLKPGVPQKDYYTFNKSPADSSEALVSLRRSEKPPLPLPSIQKISKLPLMTFTCNTLMIGSYYEVQCCYIENGPYQFSVHLLSTIPQLETMTIELEKYDLKNLEERPALGMACIARFPEDGQLYRAVIMDIQTTKCQVAYVDYGNTEYVPFSDIYEIPPKFLEPKIFAIRFALSGYKELEPMSERIKELFKKHVLHQELRIKVMPLEGPPLVQYCELYDENNMNILDYLKKSRLQKYAYLDTITCLTSGDMVVICYVESPKKFFVHKVQNIYAFDKMMDKLFLYCEKIQIKLTTIDIGLPCAVKFENAWYRAEIISHDTEKAKIKHVDFGNEREIDIDRLYQIDEEFLTIPCQAIECCLKGFEVNRNSSDTASVQLEMLAEGNEENHRRHFKCHIFEVNDNIALVNLIDETMRPELNLMKKLYKLSMPFNKYIGLEKEGGLDINCSNESLQQQKQIYINSSLPTSNNSENQVSPQQQHKQSNTTSHHFYDSGGSNSSVVSNNEINTTTTDNNRQLKRSNNRPFKEYNNKRDKEQSYQTYKTKANLPPRFQKQQSENKRYKENKMYTNDNQRSSSTNYQQTFTETWNNDNDNISYNNTTNQQQQNEEYLPLLPNQFRKIEIDDIPKRENVFISWWISPHQFYIQPHNQLKHFENMMKEMQSFYKNKPPLASSKRINNDVNAHCIIRNRLDKLFYRAKILAYNQKMKKYKVDLLDFGNSVIIDENNLWSIEKRFIKLPIMAYQCSFDSILSNLIDDKSLKYIEKYIQPGTVLVCEYLRKDEQNDIYFVELELNNQSLKELLIQDGVISAIEPDLNMKLLCGRQIQGRITSVNDLLNFQIEIDGCDLKLLCSYNDIKFIKSNPNLSIEFKDLYEGTVCIFDILDVTRDKIVMVQPLIPLFSINIPKVICDYPIMSQAFNVKIAYIETPNIIYVHSSEARDQLYLYLDEMYEYYENQGKVLNQISIGTLCAVKSSDENWYRARIISLDNDKVIVQYIDYGNTEQISDYNEKIKELDDKFYELSALAIKCFLPIKLSKSINNDQVIEEMKRLMMSNENIELMLNILEFYKNSSYIIDISIINPDNNNNSKQNLTEILSDKSLILSGRDLSFVKDLIDNTNDQSIQNGIKRELYYDTFNDENVSTQQKQQQQNINNEIETKLNTELIDKNEINNEKYQQDLNDEQQEQVYDDNIDDQLKNMQSAYLSHCDNPGRFFLHLTDDYNELRKLQDNIQIVANSLPPLMSIVTGALCITLYSVDETWYRAKIIDNEIMAVQFLDYGNTDVVIDISSVKEMNEAFSIDKIKPFAIPCALPIAPFSTTDWKDEANQIFNEAYDKIIHFKYISKGEKKNYVKLMIDGKNVTEKLIEDGLGRRLEVIETGEKCFISHINNLSDFYIQLERDTDGLELIACHLSDAENFPEIKYFTKGLICAAIFPDDGEWYRAMLLNDNENGEYEVLFIDYGNTAIVTQIREISQQIATIPFLSKKCTLYQPDYVLGWSNKAEEKFKELSAMGQTIFEVELIEPADHAIVNLYTTNGENILKELEMLCDKRPPPLNMTSSTDEFDFNEDNITVLEKSMTNSNNDDDGIADDNKQNVVEEKFDRIKQDLHNAEVIVCYSETPNKFFIQKSVNPMLTAISEQINSKDESLKTLTDPTVGDLCVAVFEEESMKYRARIVSKLDDNWEVEFIDFGNIATTNQIYRLPTELIDIPALAFECKLYNPHGIDFENDVQALEAYTEIISDHYDKSARVEIIEQKNGIWVVRLHDEEKDIYEEIKNKSQQKQETVEEDPTENQNEPIENVAPGKSMANSNNDDDGIADDNKQNVVEEKFDRIKQDLHNAEVIVCYSETPNKFFIQKSVNPTLTAISEQINSKDESLETLTDPTVGDLCVAVFEEESMKYRARIASKLDDNWEVEFIDFGNIATTNQIYRLPIELIDIPALAFECELYNPDGIDFENDVQALEAYTEIISDHYDKSARVEIIEQKNGIWVVRLHDEEKDIYEEIKNKLQQKQETVKENPTENQNEPIENVVPEKSMANSNNDDDGIADDNKQNVVEEKCDRIKQDLHNAEVIVCYSETPNKFFIQKSVNPILTAISEQINSKDESLETLTDPTVGDLCVAVFEEESMKYRARIVSKLDDNWEVEFIDFGNIATTNQIYRLPTELIDIPALAFECELYNPDGIDFENDVQALETYTEIISAHYDKSAKVEIIEQKNGIWVIRLHDEKKDIYEEIKNKLQQKQETVKENPTENQNEPIENVPEKSMANSNNDDDGIADDNKQNVVEEKFDRIKQDLHNAEVIVCYSETPNKFFIQKSVNPTLTAISEQINSKDESLETLTDPTVGDLCVAVFEEESMKYRARIASKLDDNWEVEFIDFGNIATTNQIYRLPTELIDIPALAFECELYNPDGIDFENDVQALETYTEIISAHYDKSAKVEIIEQKNGIWVVRLHDEEKDIYEEIKNKLKQKQETVEENSTENQNESIEDVEISNLEQSSKEKSKPSYICIRDKNGSNHNDEDNEKEMKYIERLNRKWEERHYVIEDAFGNKRLTFNYEKSVIEFAYISLSTGPDDFYIQFNHDIPLLNRILEYLEEEWENLEDVSTPIKNVTYAVLNPSTGKWVRGRIINEVDKQVYMIRFIDTGHTQLCKKIKKLPNNLEELENLSKHCSLQLSRDNLNPNQFDHIENYDEMNGIFSRTISSNNKEAYYVKVLNQKTDPWIVKLYFRKGDLLQELMDEITDVIEDDICNIIINDIINDSKEQYQQEQEGENSNSKNE